MSRIAAWTGQKSVTREGNDPMNKLTKMMAVSALATGFGIGAPVTTHGNDHLANAS